MSRRRIHAKGNCRIIECILMMVLIGAAATAMAAANRSNAPRASSEGEGMRMNSVLLNGAWEFSTGGGEHAETQDAARRLKWKTVNLPGQFMPWNQEVANNTRVSRIPK